MRQIISEPNATNGSEKRCEGSQVVCSIWDSHIGDCEESRLLGCDAMSSCIWLQERRRNKLLPQYRCAYARPHCVTSQMAPALFRTVYGVGTLQNCVFLRLLHAHTNETIETVISQTAFQQNIFVHTKTDLRRAVLPVEISTRDVRNTKPECSRRLQPSKRRGDSGLNTLEFQETKHNNMALYRNWNITYYAEPVTEGGHVRRDFLAFLRTTGCGNNVTCSLQKATFSLVSLPNLHASIAEQIRALVTDVVHSGIPKD
jgi:hypothetical protein